MLLSLKLHDQIFSSFLTFRFARVFVFLILFIWRGRESNETCVYVSIAQRKGVENFLPPHREREREKVQGNERRYENWLRFRRLFYFPPLKRFTSCVKRVERKLFPIDSK